MENHLGDFIIISVIVIRVNIKSKIFLKLSENQFSKLLIFFKSRHTSLLDKIYHKSY